MKNLIFFIILFSTVSFSHEYDFKNLKGNNEYVIKNGVVKNIKGERILYIKGDGKVTDLKGRRIGIIEKSK